MIGATIDGRYRVLRVLGQGGMGAVYEAEHTGTGRRVAVKVINADMAQKTEMVLRFQREARVAGSIETPHIVQVLDTGTDPTSGTVYMVMEFLRGEDLQQLIKRLGRVPPLTALRLIGQACIGLGKAHAAGVIHRDIKPANLFLCVQEGSPVTVKVVDFGIAKIMVEPGSGDEAGLTRTGGMLGSPLYMSPEQATGRKTIDHRTDVWSLGVVLYQALSGRVPHLAETLGALIMAICSEPVPPLQSVAPWVPTEIAEIVHRSLAPDPSARFSSMAALLQAIQQLVPDRLSVDVAELVPLTEAELAQVALRPLIVSAGAGQVAVTVAVAVTAASAPALGGSQGASTASGQAALSVSQGTPGGPGKGRSRLAPALAITVALGGGLAAYAFAGRTAVVAPASDPVVTTAPASPSTAGAPAAIVAPVSAADERVVRVAVEPIDATVEVDGRLAPIKDGFVEIRGVLGSAHHVRIVKDQQETASEVAITSLGAVPPKVQAAAADARPRKPMVEKARAAPSASAKPSAKPRDQALDGKFE